MEVVVDGIIYQHQAHGGISRIFSEILPRMCTIDDTLRVMVFTSGRLRQPLPAHQLIRHRRLFPIEIILRPSRLWRPVVSRMRTTIQDWSLGDGRGTIWHSTYYTRLKHWVGKEVVTVHDMIHERYPDLFDRSSDEVFRRQKQECISKADAILCATSATLQDLYGFFGTDLGETYIVPNAPSSVFRQLDSGVLSGSLLLARPFLLYVGERYHYKNFGGLLQGYREWSQHSDADLVVVGGAWAEVEKRLW